MAEFPRQDYLFKKNAADVAGIDRQSFQILMGNDGEPILTFTRPPQNGADGTTPVLDDAAFGAGGTAAAKAILVGFRIPRGLRRVKNLLGDRPRFVGGRSEEEAPELAAPVYDPQDNSPRDFVLAAQVNLCTSRTRGTAAVLPDSELLAKKKKVTINDPMSCSVSATRGGPTGKPCMQLLMVDAEAREYACFVYDHEKHYPSVLRSQVTDWEGNPDIGDRIYMVPALIKDKELPVYNVVWQPFLESGDRARAHQTITECENDYDVVWETAKNFIPEMGIRMSRSFQLNQCP
ncbi:hypothetical protein [Lewinella sp. IMCC34183]|uniref:hypothetical protein n=1 Tax=Lewinella sp. IMCC34183 TaxID=2248762 RepID=UPI000E2301C5|nr:hypothetical protein [Lewinella sp. IMCC34183]